MHKHVFHEETFNGAAIVIAGFLVCHTLYGLVNIWPALSLSGYTYGTVSVCFAIAIKCISSLFAYPKFNDFIRNLSPPKR